MHALQSILHRNKEHNDHNHHQQQKQQHKQQKQQQQPTLPKTKQQQQPNTNEPSSSSNHHQQLQNNNNNENTLHTVKVVCRLRPRLPDESTADQSVVEVLNNTEIRITDPVKQLVNRFDFSACYDEQSGQHDIYHGQVHDMVIKIFEGVTATIFTFGCTGSGKTHTLQGSANDPGITPRAVRTIFERVESLTGSPEGARGSYELSITCFEIWKDKVWDLLVQGGTSTTRDVGRGDLPIREAANGQIIIPHLRHVTIKSIAQFDKLYAQVMRFRSVSSTKLNHTSSRSHAILTIHLHHLAPDSSIHHLGKCVLIDLAGSENNKKTGNEHNKERMKESVEINQSLLALRKVVRSLNTGDHRIPYRDSKLTRILSDSLGGTSAGLVICNIAPLASQYRDTINTLTFGSHSRNVENKVSQPALEVLDRKFLLPSLSLYQHHSKSVPSLSTTQLANNTTDGATSRSPIKLSWARRPSVDAFSKLPFPHSSSKSGGGNPVQGGGGGVTNLNIRSRKLSGCFTSPSSSSSSSNKPTPTHRKLSFRPSVVSLHAPFRSPSASSAPSPERSNPLSDDLDKRVQEAMRKNLDQIVQNRVDILLQAKLNEGNFVPRSGRDSSTLVDTSTISQRFSDHLDPSSPTSQSTTTTATIQINGNAPNHSFNYKNEDGDRLEERICHLEQQFVSISNLLHSVSTSSRPKSETKIPRPSFQ
ncbi:uncharacterized protein PGTG_17393 [Puccinia graminis f. sp. tritici CRL 75-36-700-3]|uniref:Kinesin motor domain-containing protein n=1 Tax=Puccinia graminis f. sp. tritici (strain CRL 75-36-700-3 / race SCCL) TaxID=418459 RepID=E3L4G2_PUCGT|nr:uncharacterized protein PGTG_17393 [Puccinia graminis f. sp. tritici CRL 75-36-700-3]EFP91437.2 hypothetical protein PGTG_17393 [Puccinia graminis f. sp. tritici CRL 75-36-700-3]